MSSVEKRARRADIDLLRGLAILFMVEAHVGATLAPSDLSTSAPLGLLAASIGGLAAPLFIAVAGWGGLQAARRRLGSAPGEWTAWLLPRVLLLLAAQLLVNVVMSPVFHWSTPGVLSLFALLALLMPLLARLSLRTRMTLLTLLACAPLLLSDWTGVGWTWEQRISADDLSGWLGLLLLSGTYPLLPWLCFALLGGLLADLDERRRRLLLLAGMLASVATLLWVQTNGETWASISGDSLLTFFPASTPFLVVSGTCVIALHELVGRLPSTEGRLVQAIGNLGRLSLSVYVVHFVPLTLWNHFVEPFDPSHALALVGTLAYVLLWIPLGSWWHTRLPRLSIEHLLKECTRRLSAITDSGRERTGRRY